MKVICVKDYHDLQLGHMITEDTELDVKEARAAVLINAGVCVKVPTTIDVVMDAEAVADAPKKTRRVKK